jgi:transposase
MQKGLWRNFDEIRAPCDVGFTKGSNAMGQALRPSMLVPRGFVVDEATSDGAAMLIRVRPASRASACPSCGTRAQRIHSRYHRRLADLPMAGKPVRLVVEACRFHCDAVSCGRRIFAERFDEDC